MVDVPCGLWTGCVIWTVDRVYRVYCGLDVPFVLWTGCAVWTVDWMCRADWTGFAV